MHGFFAGGHEFPRTPTTSADLELTDASTFSSDADDRELLAGITCVRDRELLPLISDKPIAARDHELLPVNFVCDPELLVCDFAAMSFHGP